MAASNVYLNLEIKKRLGSFMLDARLSLRDEIGILFGPSGAGKSLLLRIIAGLEKPDAGFIDISGIRIVDMHKGDFAPTKKRRVGMVFQNLALFPHLTAMENIAYGLEKSKSMDSAKKWMERMRLAGLEERYPHQLSGGQRQRVALARALAASPKLLLLDEPFSALDTPLRRSLRRELKQIHRETGIPALYVTHSIDDVCSLGDRVFPIEHGQLDSSFPVAELWKKPTNACLCRLLGWGNCISGRITTEEEISILKWNGGSLRIPTFTRSGREITVFIAPSDVKLLYPDIPLAPELDDNVFEGDVVESTIMGSMRRLSIDTGFDIWQVEFPFLSYSSIEHSEGDRVRFAIPESAIHSLGGDNSRE